MRQGGHRIPLALTASNGALGGPMARMLDCRVILRGAAKPPGCAQIGGRFTFEEPTFSGQGENVRVGAEAVILQRPIQSPRQRLASSEGGTVGPSALTVLVLYRSFLRWRL